MYNWVPVLWFGWQKLGSQDVGLQSLSPAPTFGDCP